MLAIYKRKKTTTQINTLKMKFPMTESNQNDP